MGSCVSSLHKNPDSAMKFQFGLRSKNDKIVIPTPVNDKSLEGTTTDAAVKSQWSNTPTVMASRDLGTVTFCFLFFFLFFVSFSLFQTLKRFL